MGRKKKGAPVVITARTSGSVHPARPAGPLYVPTEHEHGPTEGNPGIGLRAISERQARPGGSPNFVTC